MENRNSYGYRSNLNYAIIGNCESAALIHKDSSIDWCCLPRFDSPSVFGKILDDKIGGTFKIETFGQYNINQEYIDNTSIVRTSFSNGYDKFDIIDYMPRYEIENENYHCPPEISRIVKKINGQPKIRIVYDPKLDYARGETNSYLKKNFIVSVIDKKHYETIYLYSNIDLSFIKTKIIC